jgi:hypothetical protein
VAEKNPKHEPDTDELLMISESRVFGPDYERYKKDLYIGVQLYAARGFLREDEAEKLEKVIDAIFENNDTIAMLPYNTKLTEEGKEVLAGKVTTASTKWIERRIEWTKREIEQEYTKGFPRLTKDLRQIKMEDFFELDEAINKQEEILEHIREPQAGEVPKRQGQTKTPYSSKKSMARRDALKQAEEELVENLFKLNAFRDEYEKDWYTELTTDPEAFMKKIELRRNVDHHERYDINAELSAFYRKAESANEAIKRAVKAQRNLDTLHKQMDKIFEDLNKARKMIETAEKDLGITKHDEQTTQKTGMFHSLQNIFSHRQLQKAETTMKKALKESKLLQKNIDDAQTEYETARDAWKTIMHGASQKHNNDSNHKQ